jgi:hypothetical protein
LEQLFTGNEDIRTYFFKTTAAKPTATTEPFATTVPITNTASLSRLLAIRQRFQHARTQLATISTVICRFFPKRNGVN